MTIDISKQIKNKYFMYEGKLIILIIGGSGVQCNQLSWVVLTYITSHKTTWLKINSRATI